MSDSSKSKWCVYMLECSDGSYYTGATNNLKKRVKLHQEGKGGKYTRSHLPVVLVYFERLPNQSAALKKEYEIKQLTHAEKNDLVKAN